MEVMKKYKISVQYLKILPATPKTQGHGVQIPLWYYSHVVPDTFRMKGYEHNHTCKCRLLADIFSYLAKDFRENKNLTCRKCTIQSSQSLCTSYQETPNMLLIQINRFSVSNLHGRPRKNNHPFGIYENIKLGLINYTLLGLIEHHGVFIDSGHYVSYIRQSNKWYHCDDKHITETNLLTLSNNVYLMFYAKEVDLGT